MYWLLLSIAVLLAIPVLLLLLEVLAAFCYRKTLVKRTRTVRPSVAVLVPAHNESEGVANTIEHVLGQLSKGDRLLVVADNCTDDTAQRALAAGAEVVERHDCVQRGKGYALDFGLSHLSASPPDVLVILDADCEFGSDALEHLVRASELTGRPVQAMYLMHTPEDAPVKSRIAEFAWIMKSHARPLGAHQLGMPCQFMGTGMAIPWRLVPSLNIATGNIVEDVQLGIDLALLGSPVLFEPNALVSSCFPSGEGGMASQRTRWEHGHLATSLSESPRIIGQAIVRRDSRLLWVGLDLAIPPLALLALVQSGLLVLALLGAALGIGLAPLWVSVFSCVSFGLAILLTWWRWGRNVISFADLSAVPGYVAAKLPLYRRFMAARQTEWVRTDRD